MASLLDRLLGRTNSDLPAVIEPKRLIAPEVKDSPPTDTKASSLALLPKGAYGESYTFFSPDGGRTMIDIADGPTTIAFLAYWYVASRWRAQKIAEPPLMVVQEDQDTGDDEWIPEHELVDLLETPSLDYDMGELLETVSYYLDNTGACLLVKDVDSVGRVARLTPFSRNEFEPKRSDDRLFAFFRVQTANGPEDFAAEDCIFFRDSHGTASWGRGRSRLDVAMSWLKLGAKAQQTIYDLLVNSVWPSAAIVPHQDWDPDPATYEAYKQDVAKYAKAGNKGKPFIALGGGQFVPLTTSLKDLVPDEILGRVESVVAAVSGVPAIVLQFQVGMENSPWSQMAQARKMAYDDCITPAWRKIERVLTRQLLRPIDEDPTHFIRFDASNVQALQQDQLVQVQIGTMMGRAASLNERRAVMGLEPLKDPKADEVPELVQPSIAELLAGAGGNNNNDDTPDDKPKPDDTENPKDTADKTRRAWIERKMKSAALQDTLRDESVPVYIAATSVQLKKDADRIVDIVMHSLLDVEEGKSIESKARGKDTVMGAVNRYLADDGRKRWTAVLRPLNEKAAQQSGALVAADMNLNFSLLHGNLLTYARKQTGLMISQVNKTTASLVSDIIQGGIDAQKSTRDIARLISEATGFDRSRAELIARTETTKIFNGAPTESLNALSQGTSRTFTKTWSGLLDEKERDEHVELEGETVAIDEEFSNGLQYPSEPNCRCSLLYAETTED